MLKNKSFLLINLLLVLAIITIGVLIIPNNEAFAETSSSEEKPLLRWAQIASNCDDDYSIIDNNAHGCKKNSSVIYNYARVTGYAEDDRGTIALTHFNSLDEAKYADINSNGPVTLTFVDSIPRSGSYYLNNDTRKMKNLTKELKISDDSTKVGYGKIMIKTKADDADAWSSWQYFDLTSANSFSRDYQPSRRVVIVIIYEVRENFFTTYNVRIQYGFHVTNVQ